MFAYSQLAGFKGINMSTTPAPSPAKRSNLIWCLFGLAGVAVLFVVVSTLVGLDFLARYVRVHRSGEQVEVSTPAGELRVNTAAEKEVGLPVYPGARPAKSGKSVEIALPTEDQVGIATAHYRTSDPFEKVDAWYRAHLGPSFERETSESKRGKVRGKGLELSTDTTAFISEKSDLVRAVALTREGNGVDITLVRAGPSEAQ